MALGGAGPDDPVIELTLDGGALARRPRVVRGSKLADPAFRKTLLDGGLAGGDASTDPLIVLYPKIDPLLRAGHRVDSKTKSRPRSAAPARTWVRRASRSSAGRRIPDADFLAAAVLRPGQGLSDERHAGAADTTFYGFFDRAQSFGRKPPFDLTPR